MERMCKLDKLEKELKELKSKCEEIRKNITVENITEVLENRTKYMIYGVDFIGVTEDKKAQLIITFEDGKYMYINLPLENVRIF